MMDVVTPIVFVEMKPADNRSDAVTDDVTAFWARRVCPHIETSAPNPMDGPNVLTFAKVARPVTVRVLVVVDVAAMKNVLSELTWILDATNMLLAR